ncbi:MAG: efflux RND transporter periplasmic adaptor subunit [Candidatus Binatia bacterium]
MTVTLRSRSTLPLLVLLILAGACARGNRYAPPPPSEVTVSQPVEQEVTTYSELTGTTAAVASIDIRARVLGYLKSINFTPGADVKQGDLLFVIEPELYQAKVDQARADLDGKQAQYQAAEEQLQITQAIFARSAGSRADLVQKTQQRDLAKAQVAMARATLEAAQLDLSYTQIYAPISGRIDRNRVDVGNLVGSGEATLLASIMKHDPIYVYFTMSEREMLQYGDMQRQRRTAASEGERNLAYFALTADTGFPHVGQVDYTSNRVDPNTGTIELRAVFPNPDHLIVPGLFARIRLPLAREHALLVPEAAVSADQGGQYLLTADDHNVVQYRRVRLGPTVSGGMQVIESGIQKDEWVIVNGLQRARPGSTVKPTRTTLQAPEPQAPTGAAPSSS